MMEEIVLRLTAPRGFHLLKRLVTVLSDRLNKPLPQRKTR